MEPSLLVVLLPAGAALLAAASFLAQLSRLRRWRAVARSCGLTDVVESSACGVVQLTALSQALRVRIEARTGDSGTRVAVDRLGRPFAAVAISAASGTADGATTSGDPSFDQALHVSGPPELVHAMLDAHTRGALLALVGRRSSQARFSIVSGQLWAEIPGKAASEDVLTAVVHLLIEATPELPDESDVPGRLDKNARHDPIPEVRLKNLLALIRAFGDRPEITATLCAACQDPHPEIRLHAARARGSRGGGVLLALAEDASVADSIAAQAVQALGPRLGFMQASATLQHALQARHIETAKACLHTLGQTKDPGAGEALAKVLAVEEPELAEAAAEALGACGGPGAEPALIQALEREPAALRVRSAEALGRVGSPLSVLPLKDAALRHQRDDDLGIAAREAIAAIQSRVAGGSPGQVSLTEGEAGQLALVDEASGRLSLPPSEADQLPLPEGEALHLSAPPATEDPAKRQA